MKISKKLIIVILVLTMLIVALVPATFSWYNHSGGHSGNQMLYERNKLPVSAGDVSIVTKRYNNEYEHNNNNSGDANKLYYDTKGNKEYSGDPLDNAGDTIGEGTTHFYGTTIKNTDSSPAYVNLYISEFTNDTNSFIGTLQPSLTHKGLSSSVHLANKSKIRVYFQWNKANKSWNENGAKTYVVSELSDGTKTVTEFDTENDKLVNKTELSNVTTYYADLADNAVSFYFATDAGNPDNINNETGVVKKAWYRTKTITNVQPEMGYYLTNSTDDTTWNAQYASFNVSGGVSVKTCFDTLSINKNQHAYLTLSRGTNFTGNTVSYSLTKVKNNEDEELPIVNNAVSGVINLNANTGFVTTGDNFDTGFTAEITTTITGNLGDTITVKTDVVNQDKISAAPVALNVMVPGGSEDNPGTAEIVWYIKSLTGCTFSKIYSTK